MIVGPEVLQRAIEFAAKAHRGGYRKGDGRPYIVHPLSVMNRVSKAKESSNHLLLATCAILHDTVEDCGVSLDEIATDFGYSVASIVEELTLDKTKYETIGKTKYLCQEMVKMSSYALAIKLCDRLDNLEDMKAMPEDFVIRYLAETQEIVDYVNLRRLRITSTHRKLLNEVQEKIDEFKKRKVLPT